MGKVGNTELYKFLQNISLEDYIPITRKSDQKLFNVPLGALLGVNEDVGTVFSQNNKIPSFYTNGSRSGYSSISEAFNNSSQILVTEEEILNVVNTYQIAIGTSISLVTKRYLLKVGKGTYGSGSENNLVDNDFLLYATEEPTVIIPVSSNNQPIVETIIVPDNSVDVFTIVNQSDQLFEIINGTDTFFVIVNQDSTDSSTNKTYRFIGSEGNYGSGNSNSLPNDFIEISNNTNVPQSIENNRLVSGVVSHLSGLQFQSTQASYYINNVLYNVNPQIVEINEGDQNNDRFDVFVLDETGALSVVEGTPNTNPAKPEIDPITQVEIGFVLVTANATVSNPPNSISIESVYDENLGEPNEWTVLASTLDTNIDSTEEPFSGSKHIKFDTSGSGASIFFFNDTPIQVEDFNTLDFMLFLKQIKLSAITIQFTLGGQPVSDYRFINNGQFNYDELDTDAYQSIVIPSSAFSFTSSSFDGIRFRFGNGVQSFQNSWLLDRIRLSLGVSNTTINQDNKSFISSPDTPETYKDQAGKFARVKSDEKGLEFEEITKNSLGLDNVDNTSDANKPISNAQQLALDNKLDEASATELATVGLSVRDENGIQQFVSNESIEFGNVDFDIPNKRISAPSNPPNVIFRGVGNEVTSVNILSNFFKTLGSQVLNPISDYITNFNKDGVDVTFSLLQDVRLDGQFRPSQLGVNATYVEDIGGFIKGLGFQEFRGNTNIQEVILPKCTDSTSIRFESNTSLTKVVIPNTSQASFPNCTSLTYLDIDNCPTILSLRGCPITTLRASSVTFVTGEDSFDAIVGELNLPELINISDNCFRNSPITKLRTPKLEIMPSASGTFRNMNNVSELYFPLVTEIKGTARLFEMDSLNFLYAPRCKAFGSDDSTVNGMFDGGSIGGATFVVNDFLRTSNAGSINANLQDAINRGVKVIFASEYTNIFGQEDIDVTNTYADDAAASIGGIQIGREYIRTTGETAVRLT